MIFLNGVIIMSFLRKQPLSTLSTRPLFSQLSDEMNRFWINDLSLAGRPAEMLEGLWQPDVDVEIRNNQYLVSADIPGVDPEEIKVSMDNGNLIIEGKRETHAAEIRSDFRRVERNYGSFYRSLFLTDAAELKGIEAHCKNGVLEVTVPISEAAKHKKIEVKVD